LTLTTSSSPSDKDYCRNELTQIEAQLTDLLNKQKEQQKATGTLKGDVAYLTSQINALKTKIKARALVIAQLKVNITEKVNTINSLSSKIDREHSSLAQLLRNTNEFDNDNLVNLILSSESISDFYSDLESYNSIKQAIKDSVDIINGVKTQNEVANKILRNSKTLKLTQKQNWKVLKKQLPNLKLIKNNFSLFETERSYLPNFSCTKKSSSGQNSCCLVSIGWNFTEN